MSDAPFAILLPDDLIVATGAGVTADLFRAYEATGKTPLSAMKIEGHELYEYGVMVPQKDLAHKFL